MRVGEVVAADQLDEALWGEAPPATWPKSPPAIQTVGSGYRLALPPGDVDAHAFERLGPRRPVGPTVASADAWRSRAFELRDNVPAYDAAYVVLAEALECPLLTRHAQLGQTVGHEARIDVG